MIDTDQSEADRWPELMNHMTNPNQTVQAFELPVVLDLAWQEIHRRVIEMLQKNETDTGK